MASVYEWVKVRESGPWGTFSSSNDQLLHVVSELHARGECERDGKATWMEFDGSLLTLHPTLHYMTHSTVSPVLFFLKNKKWCSVYWSFLSFVVCFFIFVLSLFALCKVSIKVLYEMKVLLLLLT